MIFIETGQWCRWWQWMMVVNLHIVSADQMALSGRIAAMLGHAALHYLQRRVGALDPLF